MSEILKWFQSDHLPDSSMKSTSQMVEKIAIFMDGAFPPSAEKSAGLRKLLEAKDCFVRCAVEKEQELLLEQPSFREDEKIEALMEVPEIIALNALRKTLADLQKLLTEDQMKFFDKLYPNGTTDKNIFQAVSLCQRTIRTRTTGGKEERGEQSGKDT